MDSSKDQNIIELCAGYGGISMGIKRVIPDIKVKAFCEIDAYAVANLVQKIEKGEMDEAPIWTDLKTFPGKDFYGKIHGIIGGYPCQPFSAAGQRRGEQDERHLFPYILKIIQAVEPLWVFFENVEGHISLGYGEVYRSLRDLGYSVEAGIFSASECGAPHRRKRLFILGYSNGKGLERAARKSLQRDSNGLASDGRKELAESQNSRFRRGIHRNTVNENGLPEPSEKQQSNVRGETKGCSRTHRKKLADTQSERSSGLFRGSFKTSQSRPFNLCYNEGYPARPGQEQFEWEEPRTIKSGMGRTNDGTTEKLDPHRIDRIRMLGNGVVPDTAELAFRTLIEMINSDSKI